MIIDITKVPTFYINLDDAEDKKRNTEKLLKKLKFENVERFPAVLDESKNIGCNISHMNVLQKIVDENIYPSLVLEDDVGIKSMRRQIEVPDDADAIYVGISKFGYLPQVNLSKSWSRQVLRASDIDKEYHRTHNMLSSHAILRLNRDYDIACINQMQKVIDNPEKYVTNDVAVAMIHPKYNIYALNDPIFYQDDIRTEKFTKFELKDHKKVVSVKRTR